MSHSTGGSAVQVSSHAIQRYAERANAAGVSPTEIEYRFRNGLQVDVASKDYTEARLVEEDGSLLVILKQYTHLATVIYAREEVVTFISDDPTLECRSCGEVRTDAHQTDPCNECESNRWGLLDTGE